MAIGDIIKYESTFKYELTHPHTGEGLGITFDLRSSSSPEVKAVMRKHLDHFQSQYRKQKSVSVDTLERQAVEKVASAIAGWDWGKNELHEGEGVPSYPEDVRKVLEVDWIFSQIDKQVNDTENFT